MLQFPPFSLKTLLHSALWSVWARAASKACAGSAVLPRVNTSLLCLWLVPFTAISPCLCQGPQTHRITSFTKKTGILKTSIQVYVKNMKLSKGTNLASFSNTRSDPSGPYTSWVTFRTCLRFSSPLPWTSWIPSQAS